MWKRTRFGDLRMHCIKYARTWVLRQREKCPNMEFFWFLISLILTESGDVLRKSQYSVQIREKTDHKNSVFGQFIRSEN